MVDDIGDLENSVVIRVELIEDNPRPLVIFVHISDEFLLRQTSITAYVRFFDDFRGLFFQNLSGKKRSEKYRIV